MADDAFKRRLENFESAHEAAQAVDTNKLNAYAAGIQKKSKREREKEAAEAKRLQEEEDAAKAYKDFVASFDDPSASGTQGSRGHKAFVRAGASGPSSMSPPTGPAQSTASNTGFRPVNATQSRPFGNPLATTSGTGAYSSRASSNQPPTAAAFLDDDGPPAPVPMPKKKRAMDNFLEELKRDQDIREQRLQAQVEAGVVTSVSAAAAQDLSRHQGPSVTGSYDTGDNSTTNLHVGNLPANVTANAIGMHFAQFGPVASVKIMWPREQGGANIGMMSNSAAFAATRAGLNGFIAFMKRSDAERALEHCDGVEWGGSILRMGWGKGMPLPPRPAYVSDTPFRRGGRSRSPSPERSSRRRSRTPEHRAPRRDSRDRPSKRFRRSRSRSFSEGSRSPPRGSRGGPSSRSRSRSRSRSPSPDRRGGRGYRRSGSWSRSRSRSRSRSPKGRRWPVLESQELRGRLQDAADKIRRYGKRFEDTLRDKERNNPSYDFLRDESLPAYHFFRMLLDPRYRAPPPPAPPFQDEGETAVLSSDDSELELDKRRNKRKTRGTLGRASRTKLEAMLRTLNNTREKIGRVMSFALDRPDAADEVSDAIIQSLLIPSTPVPRKIARLNVISDILHNCAGTPTNAWKYRSLFEAKLPPVFTHFGEIYKSFPGRMKAEVFRKQVMTVMEVWEQWLVFNPSILQDYEKRLSTGEDEAELVESNGSGKHTEAPQAEPSQLKQILKAPTGFAKIKIGEVDTSLGEEDLDGEEIKMADVADEDDLDGAPMELEDDDLDGAPM